MLWVKRHDLFYVFLFVWDLSARFLLFDSPEVGMGGVPLLSPEEKYTAAADAKPGIKIAAVTLIVSTNSGFIRSNNCTKKTKKSQQEMNLS